MYKRQDNDIFGTATIGFAPRIENNSFVDPHAAFKKKTEQNYQNYSSKLNNISHVITNKPIDSSKVNQQVNFQEDYHKNRKELDLQSSIFYPPNQKAKQINEKKDPNAQNNPTVVNKNFAQTNYGRRQTFKREVNNLPYNSWQIKGNNSRLFGMDERVKPYSDQHIPLAPLIPNKMQWDQHDSVKYSHINQPNKQTKNYIQCPEVDNVSISQSTYIPKESQIIQKTHQIKQNEKNKLESKKIEKNKKQVKTQKLLSVQIKILKGWNFKYMQGLSKHCKLNNSAILKFQTQSEDKVTIVLKKSERWQNVSDWLRKDCKLKLRVMN